MGIGGCESLTEASGPMRIASRSPIFYFTKCSNLRKFRYMSLSKPRIKAAILGTGNIGSDLLFKIVRDPGQLDLALFVGIDPESEGIKRAETLGVKTAGDGIDSILSKPEIKIVFDATSAQAHLQNAPKLAQAGKFVVDMTPAAIGPYCSPCVNLAEHLQSSNVNLVTCGGQATIPLVQAVSRVTPVEYAEIVSTVGSASAGPGTRQNIDEFTVTTARGLEVLGGAARAKAIIILNPAKPPILMRNTIYIMAEGSFNEEEVTASIESRIMEVQTYVPGYRLKGNPVYGTILVEGQERPSITLLLEIKGAGDFLPEYAGNLDIMTASAWQVGQKLAASFQGPV